MPFKHIVIAVDGSAGGLSATRLGGEIAAGRETEVLLVHAVALPPIVADIDQEISDQSITYLEDVADRAIAMSQDVLDSLDVKHESIIKPGSPAEIVLAVAEERDADLIVVGHRGHGAMKRLLLGSVSSKLAHHAHCALLLAPVTEE